MFNLFKIMFNIKDVIVDRISLVSKGKRPAVARAETSFSIFKTSNKVIFTPEQKEKLEKISKNYDEMIKKNV